MSALASMTTMTLRQQMMALSIIMGETTTTRLPALPSSAHTKHNARSSHRCGDTVEQNLPPTVVSVPYLTYHRYHYCDRRDRAPRLMRPVDTVLPEPRIILKDTYKNMVHLLCGLCSVRRAHIIFIAE